MSSFQPTRLLSATNKDYAPLAEQILIMLGATIHQSGGLGTGSSNLDMWCDRQIDCDELIHLVGPSIGGAKTTANEVKDFLNRLKKDNLLVRNFKAEKLWQQLWEDKDFLVWPRTYWEAYIALLLGKPVHVFWEERDKPNNPSLHHPEPQGQKHYQVFSDLGWQRLVTDKLDAREICFQVSKGSRKWILTDDYASLTQELRFNENSSFIPRKESDVLLAWLNRIWPGISSKSTLTQKEPEVSKAFIIEAPSNAGKSWLVAACLAKNHYPKLSQPVVGGFQKGTLLYFRCGKFSNNFSFDNLILGAGYWLLGPSESKFGGSLQSDDPSVCAHLCEKWFLAISQEVDSARPIVLWIDSIEHALDTDGYLRDPKLKIWSDVWSRISNKIYVLVTSTCPVTFLRRTNTLVQLAPVESCDGAQWMSDQLERIMPPTKSRPNLDTLEYLAARAHGLPGMFEWWCWALTIIPDQTDLKSVKDPERNVIIHLPPRLRRILITLATVPPGYALREKDLCEIGAGTLFELRETLKKQCSPFVIKNILGEDEMLYTLHDVTRSTLRSIRTLEESQKITIDCVEWLKSLCPKHAISGRSSLERWIEAMNILCEDGRWMEAVQLINEIDKQCPPESQVSLMFKWRRAHDVVACRERLAPHLPIKDGGEPVWQNFFQLGLAYLRLGNVDKGIQSLNIATTIACNDELTRHEAISRSYVALARLPKHGDCNIPFVQALNEAKISIQRVSPSVVHKIEPLRRNLVGYEATFEFTQALGEKDNDAQLALLERAVNLFTEAASIPAETGMELRQHKWWHLKETQARLVKLIASGVKQGTPCSCKLMQHLSRRADISKMIEPEIQTDALLFLSDYHYRLEEKTLAADFARTGFGLTAETGNSHAQKQFAVRCLLVATPNESDLIGLKTLFGNDLPSVEDIDRLLFPLRTEVGSLFKIPTNGPARVFERLKKLLAYA
jgi:hypothetical protein